MVDNLRSRCDGRAIAGAGNHVRRCFRTSLASSMRCVAQVVAGTPRASTRSSAACSLSRRSRARTVHASGLNHQTQRNASATICSIQSPRRACASSCSSTTRIRSADHSDADAGSMTTGRRQPHVATRPRERTEQAVGAALQAVRPRKVGAQPMPRPIRHTARRGTEPAESRQPDQEHTDTGHRAHQPDRHGQPADDVVTRGGHHRLRRNGGSEHTRICRNHLHHRQKYLTPNTGSLPSCGKAKLVRVAHHC